MVYRDFLKSINHRKKLEICAQDLRGIYFVKTKTRKIKPTRISKKEIQRISEEKIKYINEIISEINQEILGDIYVIDPRKSTEISSIISRKILNGLPRDRYAILRKRKLILERIMHDIYLTYC